MPFQKGDFIEIEFTGSIKDGEIFDSNIKEDLSKTDLKIDPKPFVLCLGQGMFLKSIDDFLIGKELGNYHIELAPEKAFGVRNSNLIHTIPLKIFREKNLNPIPGAVFNFDNMMGKVLTVSGGRVMIDFNGPLAGKIVIYKIKVRKKITDLNEKIKAFIDFLFRKEFKFEVKNNSLIISVDPSFAKFVELFKDKFKEVFNLDLKVEELEENREKQLQ
jgi:FKBP-type peptidyl-prolyl cis-trans isomerase 2